jgi:hypothetical protein
LNVTSLVYAFNNDRQVTIFGIILAVGLGTSDSVDGQMNRTANTSTTPPTTTVEEKVSEYSEAEYSPSVPHRAEWLTPAECVQVNQGQSNGLLSG